MTIITLIWILTVFIWALVHSIYIKKSKTIWKPGPGEKVLRGVFAGAYGMFMTWWLYGIHIFTHSWDYSLPDGWQPFFVFLVFMFLIGFGIFGLFFDPFLNVLRGKKWNYISTTNGKKWDEFFQGDFWLQRGFCILIIILGISIIILIK